MRQDRNRTRQPGTCTEVVLVNRQRGVSVPEAWKDLLKAAVSGCVETVGFPYPAEVHVTLVGSRTIRRMNRDFRGKDAVTDVLSFPEIPFRAGKPVLDAGDIDPETGCCFLGDLVICLPRMQEQAAEYGHGENRELAFLAAHGTLHLLGHDHEDKAGERVMFELQETVLAGMGLPRREAGQ